MTELLRCANCGIADGKVVHFPPPQGPVGYDSHRGPCLQAALDLLRECGPYVQWVAFHPQSMDAAAVATASALLAKLPKD